MANELGQIPGREDATAVAILKKYSSAVLERSSPRSTIGDGNCGYRAVALSLFGTEDLHTYVRLRAACEMLEHRTLYDTSSLSCIFRDDRVETPPIDGLITDVLTDGHCMELMHLYAVSSAFNVAIKSYSPPTSSVGLTDSPYTTTIVGRGVLPTTAPSVTVMWTIMSMPIKDENFIPDHIVWLAERIQQQPQAIDSDNDATDKSSVTSIDWRESESETTFLLDAEAVMSDSDDFNSI